MGIKKDKEQMPDRSLVFEISNIIASHCKNCEIKKQIRRDHGSMCEQRYCNEICKIGQQLQERGRKLNKMDGFIVAKELGPDEYEGLKMTGHTDREICEIYNIGTTTLYNRKKKWGFSFKREYTLSMYKGMRKRGYNDREIQRSWRISYRTMKKLKEQWGI